MTHKVGKITLDLPASSYTHAQEQQRQAGQWANQTLTNILQKTFDKLCPNGEYVFLDKIEITVDAEPWNRSAESWEKIVYESIKLSDNEHIATNRILEELHFFLQNGYVLKSQTFENFKDFEVFFTKKWPEFLEFFGEKWAIYSFEPSYFQRFFSGFSPSFLQNFIEDVIQISAENSQSLLKQIKIFALKKPEKLPDLIRFIFSERKKITDKNFIKIDRQITDFHIDKINSIFIKSKEIIVKREPKIEQNKEEGILLSNAGLVLLFPYIKPFFEAIGLLNLEEFKNEKSQLLAIKSLHYLATGKRKCTDNELFIEKLMIGWPLENFVNTKGILPKYIADEADELLNAVREHWVALAGSSIEALRQSFLQRSGLLYFEPASVLLKVENSGIDVLLGQIPWGFRHFKLPWMLLTIITEWY